MSQPPADRTPPELDGLSEHATSADLPPPDGPEQDSTDHDNTAQDTTSQDSIEPAPEPVLPRDVLPPAAHDGPVARRLVIAYAFAPDRDPAAIAAARRVITDGEPVDVISNPTLPKDGGPTPRDHTIGRLLDPLLRRQLALDTTNYSTSWRVMSEFCERGVAAIEPHLSEYTSLYSRGDVVHSHALAALLRHGHEDLTWTAEFPDGGSRDTHGNLRKGAVPEGEWRDRLAEVLGGAATTWVPDAEATIFEWAETLAYAVADRVVFADRALAQRSIGWVRHPDLRERLSQVASVADYPRLPASAYTAGNSAIETADGGPVQIASFGNFRSRTRVAPVLEAVAALSDIDRARIRLHLFTASPATVTGLVRELSLEDRVQIRPRLDYLDFLATARAADVILAFDAATAEPGGQAGAVLRTRWADYAGAGRPVWGVIPAPADPETAHPDGARLTYRSPHRHVTAAMQVLTRIARDQDWDWGGSASESSGANSGAATTP